MRRGGGKEVGVRGICKRAMMCQLDHNSCCMWAILHTYCGNLYIHVGYVAEWTENNKYLIEKTCREPITWPVQEHGITNMLGIDLYHFSMNG